MISFCFAQVLVSFMNVPFWWISRTHHWPALRHQCPAAWCVATRMCPCQSSAATTTDIQRRSAVAHQRTSHAMSSNSTWTSKRQIICSVHNLHSNQIHLKVFICETKLLDFSNKYLYPYKNIVLPCVSFTRNSGNSFKAHLKKIERKQEILWNRCDHVLCKAIQLNIAV